MRQASSGTDLSLALAVDQNGILPDHMIAVLVRDGAILRGYDLVPDQVQPASLDLRLGEVAYRVRASFLPGPDTTVAQRIDELKLHEIALGDGAVLETGCVYIVPLIESLALPDDIAAAANPKSSTGRLDVFTRVIADETRGFDHVAAGYHGPLYAEISPRTFPVLVREGSRLSQIRFRHGNALLDGESLRALHARERLVDDSDADVSEGIAVSVALSGLGPDGLVGYRAKRHTGVIDVERRAGYDVGDFWELMRSRGERSLILDPGEFYILASKEAVQVPAGMARAQCWRCARAKCLSSSSTGRSWGGSSTRTCWRDRARSTVRESGRITRHRDSSCRNISVPERYRGEHARVEGLATTAHTVGPRGAQHVNPVTVRRHLRAQAGSEGAVLSALSPALQLDAFRPDRPGFTGAPRTRMRR